MSDTILVVAAHPDDEVLGCGGTIAKHIDRGDKVHILHVSEGVSSRFSIGEDGRDWGTEIAQREQFARNASKVLGMEAPLFLRHPNLRMHMESKLFITKQIEDVLENVRPSTIYTTHPGDMNTDHGVTFECVLTACRPVAGKSVRKIFAFEVLSSTEWCHQDLRREFLPNHFVNIAPYFDMKLESVRCYDYEMREYPHPRSQEIIECQAKLRGAQVGIEMAEAFVTIRSVED